MADYPLPTERGRRVAYDRMRDGATILVTRLVDGSYYGAADKFDLHEPDAGAMAKKLARLGFRPDPAGWDRDPDQ